MSLVTPITQGQIDGMHELYAEKSKDCSNDRLFRFMLFRLLNYYLYVIASSLYKMSQRPNNGREG